MRSATTRPLVLSTGPVAELLGVHRATLLRQASAGTSPIPAVKVGRSVRWRSGEVAQILGISVEQLWDRLGLADDADHTTAATAVSAD